MEKRICIGNRWVGKNEPVFIIAEMSANHNMDFERAKEIIKGVKEAGADAVKLQTYTADTITIDCDNDYFQITQGTLWDGTTLYKLYQKAYTPWEWQGELKEYAESMGLICFSSPFDFTAVDFLEDINVPAYKIASFEITDIPLIRKIARLGKPILISTGIAYLKDIELARESGQSKATISRITNYKNGNPKYQPSLRTIQAIALALKLSREQRKELFDTAFPEFRVWEEAAEQGYTVDETNDILYEKGLPLLTTER